MILDNGYVIEIVSQYHRHFILGKCSCYETSHSFQVYQDTILKLDIQKNQTFGVRGHLKTFRNASSSNKIRYYYVHIVRHFLVVSIL